MSADVDPILDVSDLTVVYRRGLRHSPLHAVDGVSFRLQRRETVGLVGESGSGKTTIGRAVLGLAPVTEGAIIFNGEDITHASYRRRRALSAELQVVFQDPYSSLNPTRKVGQTLAETLRVHHRAMPKHAIAARIDEMLERVGLPLDAAQRYPAHFSGGQRQRIAIARALMADPRLVICDEPTSALDLSVQAQVVNLLRELQEELGLSYLFISHDLSVVRHLSHRVIVLYQGTIMEQSDATSLYERPLHPYTQTLLAAAPVPDPVEQRIRRMQRTRATDDSPTNGSAESCPFAPRCPHALDLCRTVRPALEASPDGTLVACHRWRELRREDGISHSRDASVAAMKETGT